MANVEQWLEASLVELRAALGRKEARLDAKDFMFRVKMKAKGLCPDCGLPDPERNPYCFCGNHRG